MAESQDHRSDDPRGSDVAEMHARREAMADNRRYIIYYTFGEQEDRETEEERKDV
jgi:hypothetical protein